MPQRVLLIEDEADLVETMSWSLGREGYTVDSRTNGADGLERALADPPPDLILLDLMLPDIPGTEVARQLRSHPRTRDTPLIMVTARAEEIDRVVGFELGCDDYLTKPFSMRELTLRMRAVLRRATPAPTAVPEGRSEQLTFGILRIDAPGHRVWVADEEIALTALEFRLLTTLFERRGRVQTREVLLSDVWGMNPDLTTRTVDTHVKRLREKLGPAAVHVETVRGVGYRFQDRPEDAGVRARRERRFGIRARMFVAALLLASAALLSAGLVAGPAIDAWLVDDAQRQLEDIARVAAAALSAPSPSGLEARASAVAQASGARLTLVAADRSVRVDTGGEDILSPAAVEVTAALSGGIGRARRPAALTGDETLFVAVPWAGAGDAGALRAARAVAVVDAAQAALRRLLLVAATVGLAMAGLIGLVAALSFARWLGSLVARVRAAIASAHGAEAPESVRVEGLAGSVGRLARELERSVSHLAQERQRQEAVLDALDEAVVALGPDGRLTMANAAASALLELPHDAIGRPLVELVRTPPLVELVRRATAGAPETISCRLIGARQRDVAAHAAPLAAPGGVVLALRDVTELRRLEGIRRDFVANVSHEMRTPITVIRANAETLLDGALEDPQAARTFTDAIGRHAQRLDTLVSDLLELARIEAGRLDLELLPLSVPDLVRRVVEAHAPMAERRDHQVTVDVPEGLRLVGHASSLERVLANLLQNAINYTPPGGHISIRASIEGEHVRLEVADDGPGIPLRHRARIFERFYRVDPGRSREMGGTGLGLAIVKHLVSAMSGTVGVRSAERSHPTRPGAVFWCDLPRA